MISLCMIVKNEEKNLKKCLAGVSGFVDEIIVADTGSADGTADIARKFTDKVYEYEWDGDFSKARNFSISKAENDWVLILDADEYIDCFLREEIESFISNPDNCKTVGRIERMNILSHAGDVRKHTERIGRLFNKNYFKYEGIIHEQIIPKEGKSYNTAFVDISVLHSGYDEETTNMREKLKRNLDLLAKAAAKSPCDPYIQYQLGKTFYVMKDYENSCLHFEKALSFPSGNPSYEYVEDLVETYGYALLNSGRYSDAEKIADYLEFYKDSPDFHFLLGLIYMNNAEFDLSIKSFLKCTKLPKGKIEGISTYLPCYNVGVIYEALGENSKALKYYEMSGEYGPAKDRLRHLNQRR